uniref:Glutathione-regulated potassium-efflux system protein KefB n=1 Tax=Candidatus Methanophaga sp. ANME-1 ERB7 TaxID=2759913 RepID=A0A7G9Z4G4_9EURY|nr:glutathione-regulated potassium-efflux system protein KefB [Methanosarcinales archaeon ANME-1 ERB7]QNO55148.1 glutathione-regulated potassium-efflux system protein KefB [Methanosarcinales archaeon ANME-1 ERB7]
MPMTISPYILLLVIAVFAFIIPILSGRIGIPAVVGEIVCGILLGLLGFSIEGEGMLVIDFLASFGLIFLMFLVGLEIDFSKVEVHGAKLFIIGTFVFIITLGISIFLTHQLGYDFYYGFYLALALSTTSVGLIVPTLREIGMLKSEFGQTILISAFIADFATMLLLTVYTIQFKKGITGEMFLIALVFILFFAVYYVGKLAIWHYPERLSAWFKSDQPSEMGVRAAFALLLVFVAISEVANVEAILGAFLAGVMFSILFRGGTVLEQKLFGIGYGFLIPIFFISVGMQFDLGALAGGGIYLVPILLVIAFVVKLAPSLLFLVRHSLKDSISAGVLLSSRLSLIIAMAAVGLELGLIDTTMESAIILLAIITCIICPTIFRKMQGGRRQAES